MNRAQISELWICTIGRDISDVPSAWGGAPTVPARNAVKVMGSGRIRRVAEVVGAAALAKVYSRHRWAGRDLGESTMGAIIAIGLDIAKSVFQVHGAHPANPVIVYRQLKHHNVMTFTQKLLTCVMGIEAYATSHH